jgi:hypothetical protein
VDDGPTGFEGFLEGDDLRVRDRVRPVDEEHGEVVVRDGGGDSRFRGRDGLRGDRAARRVPQPDESQPDHGERGV